MGTLLHLKTAASLPVAHSVEAGWSQRHPRSSDALEATGSEMSQSFLGVVRLCGVTFLNDPGLSLRRPVTDLQGCWPAPGSLWCPWVYLWLVPLPCPLLGLLIPKPRASSLCPLRISGVFLPFLLPRANFCSFLQLLTTGTPRFPNWHLFCFSLCNLGPLWGLWFAVVLLSQAPGLCQGCFHLVGRFLNLVPDVLSSLSVVQRWEVIPLSLPKAVNRFWFLSLLCSLCEFFCLGMVISRDCTSALH